MNKKVGVVNRLNFKNFGSVLQCFALVEAIRTLGYESEIVWVKGGLSANYDIRIPKLFGSLVTILRHPSLISKAKSNLNDIASSEVSEETSRLFDSFVNDNVRYSLYSSYSLRKKSKNYYKFVCGSDQIWNPNTLYLDPLLFLRFAPATKRIAYAPSLGCDFIPHYNTKKLKKYINDIPFVSIREKKGQELIKGLCNLNCLVVCDPTLLFDEFFWAKYATKIHEREYILCYFLNKPNDTVCKQLLDLSNSKRMNIISLNSNISFDGDDRILYPNCGPSEFLGFIKNANIVFTDSYHGLLFSLIFNKEFVSIERNYLEHNQSSRQKSILDELGIGYKHTQSINLKSLESIDYDDVNRRLKLFKEKSLDYLKKSLEA